LIAAPSNKVDQQLMTKHLLQFLLLIVILQSCVDRISIPEEKSGSLVLNCEAVHGSSEITATLATSNNLNGTEPILAPEDGEIQIFAGTNFDAPYPLKYDADRKVYKTETDLTGLWQGKSNFRIVAKLPSDLYEDVQAKVVTPAANDVIEITATETVEATVGDDVFQGRDLTIVLAEPNVKPAFYKLRVIEKVTTAEVVNGELVYTPTEEQIDTEITDVLSGGAGIVNLVHRDGVLLDQSRMIDNTFSIRVNATSPKQSPDQVFNTFSIELLSVSKDFYDYHRAKSNTISASDGTLNEPAIWSSNIEGGFGLFSTAARSEREFQID